MESKGEIAMALPSLSDRAYELLKNDIITCVLEPGQQIAQRQLGDRYEFGMTPVREALQRLTQEGLVQPIPRFGYIVTPVTLSDVREIFELRSILESAAARLAVERGTQADLQKIAKQATFSYVYKDRSSYIEFLTLNTKFHRAVAVLTGNGRLVDQISRLLDEMTRIFHLGLDLRDSAAEMRGEHINLAQALVVRDAELAVQVVGAQIARSQERIFEALTSGAATLRYDVQVDASH
jgi:DNA-binding GntR family transcriptional regulator